MSGSDSSDKGSRSITTETGPFRHIVTWKYKESVSTSVRSKIVEELKLLPYKIKGIKSFTMNHDAGVTEGNDNYDFVLVADFVSKKAYEGYVEHEDHTSVVRDFIKPNIASRVAVQQSLESNITLVGKESNSKCNFRQVILWQYNDINVSAEYVRGVKDTIINEISELPSKIFKLETESKSKNKRQVIQHMSFNEDAKISPQNYNFAAVVYFESLEDYKLYRDHPAYKTMIKSQYNKPDISSLVQSEHFITNPYIEGLPLLSSPLEQDAFRNYKYSGADLSLTYKYLLSPWAQFCVDSFIPQWMAPNLITFLGLLAPCLSIFFFYLYTDGGVLDQPAPSWVYFFNSLALFAYQTLDNMDGKQARKTGTSSALGMLFDHGCDAINSGIGAINFISIIGAQLQQPWVLLMCLATPMVPFYVATWEEYYVHALVLPVFNGPSEGVLIGCCIGIISGIFGADIWWKEIPIYGYDIQPAIPAFSFSMLVMILTVLVQIANVLCKCHQNGIGILKPLMNLMPFLCLCAITIYLFLKAPFVAEKSPRILIMAITAAFVEMACALMLTHMAKIEFVPFHRFPLLLALSGFAYLASHREECGLDEDSIISILYKISFSVTLYTFIYLCAIVISLCKILDIYCFRIKFKQKKM